MHKASLIFFGLLLLFKIDCFAQFGNETITITTYYPSPYGVYRNLELFPSDEPTDPTVKMGVMFFNQTSKQVMVHNGTQFIPMGGGSDGLWRENGADIENTNPGNVTVSGNISVNDICTGGGICLSTAPFQTGMIEGFNPTCPTGTIVVMKASGGVWYTETGVSSWDKVVCGKQTTPDGTPMLVNKQHTEGDCSRALGTVEPDGAGNNMCRFGSSANPIGTCPSPWREYQSWYTTEERSASNPPCAIVYSGSHTWANNAVIECGCSKTEKCCAKPVACFLTTSASGVFNNRIRPFPCQGYDFYIRQCTACGEQNYWSPCNNFSCGCNWGVPVYSAAFAARIQVGCY